jgi:metal-dependent amidase/aminoacylase/carboxypeptidase family protein
MDALPGIGHACGHNLIAIGGVGAALGVKAAMEKHGIEGKIVLLGTPGSFPLVVFVQWHELIELG